MGPPGRICGELRLTPETIAAVSDRDRHGGAGVFPSHSSGGYEIRTREGVTQPAFQLRTVTFRPFADGCLSLPGVVANAGGRPRTVATETRTETSL